MAPTNPDADRRRQRAHSHELIACR